MRAVAAIISVVSVILWTALGLLVLFATIDEHR
jgi:hypothetical protein